MSNVVSIGLPRRPNLSQRQAILLESFACHRRSREDVFWLKENAEYLNVLANSNAELPAHALHVFEPFYAEIEERLRFFPQYYRFLLSICLDLEDLGMPGHKGAVLCKLAEQSQLPAAELSDLQRAEAERLLARRGVVTRDPALRDRLHAFISHSATFALPNKKAAYELTHIVFYLSNYGTHDPELARDAIVSLEFAGLMAYLDQDVDLLAEVCVALRFAGRTPSEIWESWLAGEMRCFSISASVENDRGADAYHEYVVTSWWGALSGHGGFVGIPSPGANTFMRHGTRNGPLREISKLMFQLGAARSSDWSMMYAVLERQLASDQNHILDDAVRSTDQFHAFFEGFSRAH